MSSRTAWTDCAGLGRRWLLAAALLAPAAIAQDEPAGAGPRNIDTLMGEPENTEQLYRVLDRELRYGKTDRARRYLAQLLAAPDLDEKLLELRETYGSGLFLKLQANPELAEAARPLVEKANALAQAKAGDPERIRRFIGNLDRGPNFRAYAIIQLRKSGAAAVPYFVEALRGRDANRSSLIDAMSRLPGDAWQAVAAVVDSRDPALISAALPVLDAYGRPEAVDSLWFVIGDEGLPTGLRAQAAQVAARLARTTPDRLPRPERMLTALAARYASGQAGFDTDAPVRLWDWRDDNVAPYELPASAAEETLGLRAAQRALILDPSNRPAKVLLLSLALDKDTAKIGIDQEPPDKAFGVTEAVLAAGPEVTADVLERAMDEGRTSVVLGAVRALGQTGHIRNLLSRDGRSGILTQALNYPDPRVQFAATDALLDVHPDQYFAYADRILQTLQRALGTAPGASALVVSSDPTVGGTDVGLLQDAGYSARQAPSGREGFTLAAEQGGFDLIVLSPPVRNWSAEDTLVNLRGDARTASIPILLLANPDEASALKILESKFDRVFVTNRPADAQTLTGLVRAGFDADALQPLTDAEKGQYQKSAVDWAVRLARGEFAHIDVAPLAPQLVSLIRVPQYAQQALEALSYVATGGVQEALASAVLDEQLSLPTRVAASDALARNIQRSSVAVPADKADDLLRLYADARDPGLRRGLARIAGSFGPDAMLVARRLAQYRPLTDEDLAAAPSEQAPATGEDPIDRARREREALENPEPPAEPADPPAKPGRAFDF